MKLCKIIFSKKKGDGQNDNFIGTTQVKTRIFSRFQMMKWITLLDSSREI